MAQKLWEKSVQVNKDIERFTVGRDREMDLYLAKHDVIGSMAHITMLESIGLLTKEELVQLLAELRNIYASAEKGEFVIEEGVEDVHSQVELMLTRRLGDIGKKIHSGRSRNDQVLLDLKLFTRTQIKEIAEAVEQLFHVLVNQSERYKDILMPGYTHLQIAMPSSFGLWFGAYAESLVDDMLFLQAAFKMCNRNPLGSAAGYGSSFPLDRTMTTRLLGFDSLNYNVVYAQMGRGKMERNVAFALATIAGTISKLAFDACMFNSQNFGFVKLPDDCTTGSSIMPHKKNPDVFELTRAKCNKLQSLPQQIMMIANNLPSGYFRDLQIIKEVFIPAFQELKDCLQMTTYIMNEIKVNEHILDDDKYLLIFSVEEVNRLAREGMPFRDAYKKVGLDIEAGKFSHGKEVHHTHEGSIGNLCNAEISELMQQTVEGFNFCGMEEPAPLRRRDRAGAPIVRCDHGGIQRQGRFGGKGADVQKLCHLHWRRGRPGSPGRHCAGCQRPIAHSGRGRQLCGSAGGQRRKRLCPQHGCRECAGDHGVAGRRRPSDHGSSSAEAYHPAGGTQPHSGCHRPILSLPEKDYAGSTTGKRGIKHETVRLSHRWCRSVRCCVCPRAPPYRPGNTP